MSVRVGISARQLGSDPRQLQLDGSRFDHLDHRAPAGEVPGDVQRGRCGQADPGPPVVRLTLGVAVTPEVVAQYRNEPGLDEWSRPLHRTGSTTVASAAASASARKVCGNGRTDEGKSSKHGN